MSSARMSCSVSRTMSRYVIGGASQVLRPWQRLSKTTAR
jgi:hypothetical protein